MPRETTENYELSSESAVVSPGFVKGMGGTSIFFFFKGRGGNNDFQGTTPRH